MQLRYISTFVARMVFFVVPTLSMGALFLVVVPALSVTSLSVALSVLVIPAALSRPGGGIFGLPDERGVAEGGLVHETVLMLFVLDLHMRRQAHDASHMVSTTRLKCSRNNFNIYYMYLWFVISKDIGYLILFVAS